MHHCVSAAGSINYVYDQSGAHLFLQGVDITNYLKTPMIDQYASIISTNPQVRHELLQLQRIIAGKNNVVVEGRDSGSVVFPHADVKFYLTACVAVRGRRWQHDQARKGQVFSDEIAIAQIEMRDVRDAERALAPLIVPEGATVVDNSSLSVEQTLNVMMQEIERKIA